MAYFTKSEARSAALRRKSYLKNIGKSYDQILKEDALYAAVKGEFDIFLSHSTEDAELVLGVKTILEETFSVRVYVDWIDDAQLDRKNVTKKSAEVLRTRMQQSKSLLYLATENSSSSKWMPWELGYLMA